MATWQDAIKALEGLENGADLAGAVRTELNRKNNEAKTLRDRSKKLLDVLGVNADADDYEDQLQGVKTSLEAIKTSGGKPDELGRRMADLEKQIKTLTETGAAEKKRADEATAKRIASVRKAGLIDTLTKAGAVKPSELAKLLEGSIKVLDDDKLVYLDGETEIDVVAGVAKYLEANPEFKANKSGTGAGSGGGGGVLRFTREQLKDPAIYQANRDAILAGKVEIAE